VTHEIETVRNIPCISMEVKDHRAISFNWKEPAMEPLPIFSYEISVFILELECLGVEVKDLGREEDKETLHLWVKKIEPSGQDEDQSD
jgi:hypothetical protein